MTYPGLRPGHVGIPGIHGPVYTKPPYIPPAPPALQHASWGLAGLVGGWELGGLILEKQFGQPQNLTSQEQEQAALEKAKNYGKNLSNSVTDKKIHQQAEYPFTGGQSSGVSYSVTVKWGNHGNNASSFGTHTASRVGKIIGISNSIPGSSQFGAYLFYNNGNSYVSYALGSNTAPVPYAQITNIVRVDGQPDTGGNPPPTQNEISSQSNNPYLLPSSNSLTEGNPFSSPGKTAPNPTNKPATNLPTNKPLSTEENSAVGNNYPGTNLGTNETDNFNQPADYPLAPGWHPVNGSADYPEISKSKTNTNTYVKNDPVLDAQKKAQQGKNPVLPNFDGSPKPINPETPNPYTDPSLNLIPPVFLKNPDGTTTTPKSLKPGEINNPDNLKPPEPTPTQTPVPTEMCQQMSQCAGPMKQGIDDINAKVNNNSDKLDALNTGLNIGESGGLAAILAKLNAMDAWLIAKQVALWNYLVFMRVMNVLTFAATIHNALMLSRDIGQTLAEALNNVLTVFGIKDADGVTQGISQAIGDTVENAVKGIIGAENYNSLTLTWKKLSSIYNSAANIAQALSSSLYGIAEGIEIVSKYTGKIGNALEKSGAIIEGVAGKFGEAFSFRTGRLGRLQNALEVGQEIASDIEEITAQALEVTENVSLINTEITNIRNQIDTEETDKDNDKTTAKNASITENEINNSDLVQPASE